MMKTHRILWLGCCLAGAGCGGDKSPGRNYDKEIDRLSSIIGDLLTTIGSRVAEDKALFTSEGYSLTENTDWER